MLQILLHKNQEGLIDHTSMLNKSPGRFYEAVPCKVTRQLKKEARTGLKMQMIWY